jgi:hypothetical protein
MESFLLEEWVCVCPGNVEAGREIWAEIQKLVDALASEQDVPINIKLFGTNELALYVMAFYCIYRKDAIRNFLAYYGQIGAEGLVFVRVVDVTRTDLMGPRIFIPREILTHEPQEGRLSSLAEGIPSWCSSVFLEFKPVARDGDTARYVRRDSPQVLALLMATHKRLGGGSKIRVLPDLVIGIILGKAVSVTRAVAVAMEAKIRLV